MGTRGMCPPLPPTAVRSGTPRSAAVLPFPSRRPLPARHSPLRAPRRTRGGRRAQRLREAPSPRRPGRGGAGGTEGRTEGGTIADLRPSPRGPALPGRLRGRRRAGRCEGRCDCSGKLNGQLLPSLPHTQMSTTRGLAFINFLGTGRI